MKTFFTIKNKLIIAGFIISAIGVTDIALAKTTIMDHSTMNHNKMMHNTKTNNKKSSMPVLEPGQSAFAAIAEIVAKLESNPDTNWNVVDIKGLREHLRDMNKVIIDAVTVAKEIDGGMQFTVTGGVDVKSSIRRMTLAHATFMNNVNGWECKAKKVDGGAVVTVLVPPQDQAKIKALGFFGMIASGSHHQLHHWKMALGQNAHD
tara:strand:+ start:367 stop:981 length:615 start_codon:yes stop_codon:yes gene_type:complete